MRSECVVVVVHVDDVDDVQTVVLRSVGHDLQMWPWSYEPSAPHTHHDHHSQCCSCFVFLCFVLCSMNGRSSIR